MTNITKAHDTAMVTQADRDFALRWANSPWDYATMAEEAARHRTASQAELLEALGDLENCEAEYRHDHDIYGGGDIRTGRAWDRLRRAGDRARAIIARIKGEQS